MTAQPPAPAAFSPTQADRIRQFVHDNYIVPARRDGDAEITLRAGDIHRDMGLTNALPAVCSAIGSNRFAQASNVTPAGRTGPANGSNAYFRFTLDTPLLSPHRATEPLPPPAKTTLPAAKDTLDLDGALVLISCVKSKMARPAPARCLYTSTLFRGARDLAEAQGARWLLLSSQYGLVAPDAVIAPYDYTLNNLKTDEREAWADKVLERLLPEAAGFRRVVMFAGFYYREFLMTPLKQRGIIVEIPMEHLTIGKQLAWLAQHR
jgi:hypothetical protein